MPTFYLRKPTLTPLTQQNPPLSLDTHTQAEQPASHSVIHAVQTPVNSDAAENIDILLQTQPDDSTLLSGSILDDSQLLLPSNQLLLTLENTMTSTNQNLPPAQTVVQLSYAELSGLLDTKLEQVAQVSDVDDIRKEITKTHDQMGSMVSQVQENASDIATIKTAISDLKDRISSDRTAVQTSTARDKNNFHRPMYKAGASCREQEKARLKKYERARRSLRVWPISGNDSDTISKKLREFLRGALAYDEHGVDRLDITWVERIRSSQKVGTYDEPEIPLSAKALSWPNSLMRKADPLQVLG